MERIYNALWWMFGKLLERRIEKAGFPILNGEAANARWLISIAGMKVGFSAKVPDSNEEMGKVLEEIGRAMQAATKARPTPMLCDRHGGYGFTSDCAECKTERHNAELSGPRPLAAEGSRSNDVLEGCGEGKNHDA